MSIVFNQKACSRVIEMILKGVPKHTAARANGFTTKQIKLMVQEGMKIANERKLLLSEFNPGAGLYLDEDQLTVSCMTKAGEKKMKRENNLVIFAQAYNNAVAAAEAAMVEHIYDVAKGGAVIEERSDGSVRLSPPDAKPMQWLAERRFRENWSTRTSVDLTTETREGQRDVDLSKLSDEELEIYIALQEKVAVLRADDDEDDEDDEDDGDELPQDYTIPQD